MLGIGLIGSGFIATQHALSAAGLVDARLCAVASVNDEQRAAFAERFSLTNHPSVEALLADESVGAVIIATPTDTHGPLALQAIAAGKHVFIEKPITRTVAEAEAVAAAASEAGVVVAVGHVIRYFPDYVELGAAIERGDVGTPAIATFGRRAQSPAWSEDDWLLDYERSGGVLLDMLIHDIDLVRWYFGEPDLVFAQQLQPGGPRGLDYTLATLQVPGGPICHIHASWCEPTGFSQDAEVCGTGGMATYDLRTQEEFAYARHDGDGDAVSALPPPRLGPDDAFMRQQQAFVDEIAGKGSLINAPEWAIASLRVAEALQTSARSGEPVHLDAQGHVVAGGAQ